MTATVLKRVLIAAIALLAFLLAAATGLIVLAIVFDYPGGMPPSYRAVNHDRRLTPVAREAAPIIQSINRYYDAHGACPHANESDVAELRGSLPQAVSIITRPRGLEFRPADAPIGWVYDSGGSDPTACTLSRKLGWDPALVWWRHGDQIKWIFVPGDGSADTPIELDTEG